MACMPVDERSSVEIRRNVELLADPQACRILPPLKPARQTSTGHRGKRCGHFLHVPRLLTEPHCVTASFGVLS